MQFRTKTSLLAGVIALGGGTAVIAGGWALQIGKPSANPEAEAKNAVLVVRAYACHDSGKTTVSARAEGLVNGKRESVALKLIPLSGESTYALTRQWPSEGKWVITLVQANPRFNGQPSAIVKVDGDAVDWADVMRLPQPPTTQEIDAALHSTAVASRL